MGRKIDWTEAKTRYVTGQEGYRQLAKEYGVSLSTLSKMAKKEGWSEARSKYRNRVHAKAVRKAETKQSQLLSKEIRLLNKIEKHLDKALSDEFQFNRHIVSEGANGNVTAEEKLFDKTDMRAMKDAMSIAREAEKMRRSLFGYLTEQEKQQLAMARERLEMDKQKVDYSEGDTEVTIRFSDSAEEWGG